MSAAAIAQLPKFDEPFASALDPIDIEPRGCAVCGHSEEVHELLLTSTFSYVICHERTDDGECFRVRHSQGIELGACRREVP
jgi:hypothetical protein